MNASVNEPVNAEHSVLNEWVDWMYGKPARPWQWWARFGFASPVSETHATRALKAWIGRAEEINPHLIYFVVIGRGERSDLVHAHALLGGFVPVSGDEMVRRWARLTEVYASMPRPPVVEEVRHVTRIKNPATGKVREIPVTQIRRVQAADAVPVPTGKAGELWYEPYDPERGRGAIKYMLDHHEFYERELLLPADLGERIHRFRKRAKYGEHLERTARRRQHRRT